MTLVKVHRPRHNHAMSTYNRDFNDLFRSFFEDSGKTSRSSLWRPAMNAQELEKEYILTYSLPGFEKKDITVSMKDHVLTVKAEREEQKADENTKYLYREIGHGSYQRSVELPENVDTEKIAAEYKNGMLHLSIPKTEAALPREIDVKIK